MKIAIVNCVKQAGVKLLLYTLRRRAWSSSTAAGQGRLDRQQEPAHAAARQGSVIDCSGDGDIAVAAGAPFEKGDAAARRPAAGHADVPHDGRRDAERLLRFVRDNPENFGLAEYVGQAA